MVLFRRIFDFKKSEVPHVEQRLNRRYTPGRDFPLEAELRGPMGSRRVQIRNMSATGLALVGSREDAPLTEFAMDLRLTIDTHVLDLKAVLAHAQPGDDKTVCGVALQFADFTQQKAWLQLLQPVVLGSTLVQVDPQRVQQREPQFAKLVFRGEEDAELSVWMDKSDGTPVHSCEFRARDFFVRAEAKSRKLEVFFREQMEDTHKGKFTAPVFDLSGEATTEARQLFRWIVLNLPDTISGDLRTNLRQIAD